MMMKHYGISAAAALTLAAIVSGLPPFNDADAGGTGAATNSQRILAIGGDVTEILYAIGADQQIVAVDSTSQYPAQALKDKKVVGYMRALSTEGVLSTAPSMIVANAGAGPPEVVKALKASGVTFVDVPDQHDPKGIGDKVRIVAKAAGAEDRGQVLAGELDKQFAQLEADRKRIGKPLRAIFVLGVQNGKASVGGAGSSGDAILALAGLQNVATSFNGYKPLVDEALVELQPDVIVVMKQSNASHDALMALGELKGLAATPAGKANRIVAMDGLYLIGFGPRTPAAARDLMRSAYPELSAAR